MNAILQQCAANNPALACFLLNIMVFIDAVIVPLVMAIAFIVFIWGVFTYFIAGGADEEKRKQGRDFVIWGVIGFVIILSLWGIVRIMTTSLGFREGETRPALPSFTGSSVQLAPQQQRNPFQGSNPGGSNPAQAAAAGPYEECYNRACQAGYRCSNEQGGPFMCIPVQQTPSNPPTTPAEASYSI